eukprot:10424163-Heterocapsa_arctica.AAC.1
MCCVGPRALGFLCLDLGLYGFRDLCPEATDVELVCQSPALSFQRTLLPLGVLGYGEGDLAHKMRLVLHALHMQTGSAKALGRMRWSVQGVCSDQGTERGLCEAPNIIDPEKAGWGLGENSQHTLLVSFSDFTCPPQVASTLQEVREGVRALLLSDPESYFFPLAIWVSG